MGGFPSSRYDADREADLLRKKKELIAWCPESGAKLSPAERSWWWNKHLVNVYITMGKSPFLMGKSTISMAISNSYVTNYQRVTQFFQ